MKIVGRQMKFEVTWTWCKSLCMHHQWRHRSCSLCSLTGS